MAILNYTTTIEAYKTVAEIENMLVKHGAKSIVKDYDDGKIVSLSFLVDTGYAQVPIQMPAKIKECLAVLQREKRDNPRKQIKATWDQAERVSWRILKDWTEAQMALIDIQMAKTEEIFLPYIVDHSGQTLFEKLEERQFLLETK